MKLNIFFVFIISFFSSHLFANSSAYNRAYDRCFVVSLVKALRKGDKALFEAALDLELRNRCRYRCENMLTPKQAYKQVRRLRKKACSVYLYWKLDQRKPRAPFMK